MSSTSTISIREARRVLDAALAHAKEIDAWGSLVVNSGRELAVLAAAGVASYQIRNTRHNRD